MKCGVLIGNIKDERNEGAILRTAEAFGINNVFVIGKKAREYYSSKGADRHMNFIEFNTEEEFIHYAKENNHSIIAIENIDKAEEISDVKKYPKNPIFIPGHENTGVKEEILFNADLIVKIKQGNGYVRCLNTGTAFALVIHDFYTKK